jgi:hypothetical protein
MAQKVTKCDQLGATLEEEFWISSAAIGGTVQVTNKLRETSEEHSTFSERGI